METKTEKKPCNCGEPPVGFDPTNQATPIHMFLERAQMDLQSALVGDIRPEQREDANELVRAIELLKNPYVTPLETQFKNLEESSNALAWQIACFYCHQVTYWGLVRKARVHWHMTRGEYWEGFKLEVWSDVKKYYWMMRAFWVRILRPKLFGKRAST